MTRETRLWATILLTLALLCGLVNLLTTRDPEAWFAVLLCATVALAVLVWARPRKGTR